MVSMRTVAGPAGGGDQLPVACEAVELRHADVHQHDVGPALAAWRRPAAPSLGLADDLDVGLGLEDHPEAGAHQRLVVGDEDPDHPLIVPGPPGSARVLLEDDARVRSSSLPTRTRSRLGNVQPTGSTRRRVERLQ